MWIAQRAGPRHSKGTVQNIETGTLFYLWRIHFPFCFMNLLLFPITMESVKEILHLWFTNMIWISKYFDLFIIWDIRIFFCHLTQFVLVVKQVWIGKYQYCYYISRNILWRISVLLYNCSHSYYRSNSSCETVKVHLHYPFICFLPLILWASADCTWNGDEEILASKGKDWLGSLISFHLTEFIYIFWVEYNVLQKL